MNKMTNNLFALSIAILIWQSGCAAGRRSEVEPVVSSATPPPTSSAPPQIVNADLETSELEAQALLDSGVTFKISYNADGGTDDGGLYTGHGYLSSDGVKIGTSRALYRQEKNAKKDCRDVLKVIDKILKKEKLADGERLVATKKASGFVIAVRSGYLCSICDSDSLKHLLAFEKWDSR